ncbi:MAG: DEAD/DEAH box helicase [Deltaproteobacteria bacterium]|nr:DEAD/DEAH box helicase [Deltaproteobacteria bacterium]
MKTFAQLGVEPTLLLSLAELGFEYPMPIQEKIIPAMLEENTDLIGLAQTGTGKTAAFGLPLLQLVEQTIKHPQVLILVPTRELCLQVTDDLKSFSKHLPQVKVVAVYGGADIDRQVRALKLGAQIIVATPGRMNDLLNKRRSVELGMTRFIVLDEADEMLNMGFKEDLDAIIAMTPKEKRMLLFSATMPREVLDIAKRYMRNPQTISVGEKNMGAESIEHLCYMVQSRDRYLALKRIIDYNPDIYGIVFCRTRQETKEIAEQLVADGYNTDTLHGDLSQAQREAIMHRFRIKNIQLLVATDVAARGLDVKDITHIINYNLPDDDSVYTHRSGRTGRAGKRGISIVIISLHERHKIRQIETRLPKKFQMSPVPRGENICEKQLLHLVERVKLLRIDDTEIDRFLPAIMPQLECLSREELIKAFLSVEFRRFLDYYKNLPDLNPPEEEPRRRVYPTGNKQETKPRNFTESGYSRFSLNVGSKDGVTPRDVIGLINRYTKKRDVTVGKIRIESEQTFFEVEARFAAQVLRGFSGATFAEKKLTITSREEKSYQREAPAGKRRIIIRGDNKSRK